MAYSPVLLAWLAFRLSILVVLSDVRPDDGRTSHQELRDWTDVGGTRHASATLLRVDGEKLWLRTADGRLTSTTLSRLSSSDQQYVASHGASDAAVPDSLSPQVDPSVLNRLPSLTQVTAWLKPAGTDFQRRVIPAALVYVRISREFLEDYVDRTVHTRKPVSDYILGTRIIGESHTDGKTHLLLHPMFGKLAGEIVFDGTVQSQSVGYNGPAIIHSISAATFCARKPISMGAAGLNVEPATASASTNLQTTGIESTLPRLRGRIATRIASRRNAEAHDEAEAISSQHTATIIRTDFDKRIDQSVARIRNVFPSEVPGVEGNSERAKSVMRFRSTIDYVEIALIREGASPEELSLRPPPIDGSPDFAIRVNRALLGATVGDLQIAQQLAPPLAKILQARVAVAAAAAAKSTADPADRATKWSITHDWVAMDFNHTGG
jgi:hypothetical protein